MGIKGFLKLFTDIEEETHISAYKGLTVAVDGYAWLHKAMYGCAADVVQGIPTDKYIEYCLRKIQGFLMHDVKVVIVMDGRKLPAKQEVEEERKQNRIIKKKEGLELLKNGKGYEAMQKLTGAVDVTALMAYQLKKECQKIYGNYSINQAGLKKWARVRRRRKIINNNNSNNNNIIKKSKIIKILRIYDNISDDEIKDENMEVFIDPKDNQYEFVDTTELLNGRIPDDSKYYGPIITFIQSPFEADSQLAYLSRHNHVDVIITEDSDLIPFGAKRILYKLSNEGWGKEIMRKNLFHKFNSKIDINNFDDEMLLLWAVLSGCDYLSSIPNMGAKKAHKYVKTYKNKNKVMKFIKLSRKPRWKIPDNYEFELDKALCTFKHQLVWDPIQNTICNITPIPDIIREKYDDLSFFGHLELISEDEYNNNNNNNNNRNNNQLTYNILKDFVNLERDPDTLELLEPLYNEWNEKRQKYKQDLERPRSSSAPPPQTRKYFDQTLNNQNNHHFNNNINLNNINTNNNHKIIRSKSVSSGLLQKNNPYTLKRSNTNRDIPKIDKFFPKGKYIDPHMKFDNRYNKKRKITNKNNSKNHITNFFQKKKKKEEIEEKKEKKEKEEKEEKKEKENNIKVNKIFDNFKINKNIIPPRTVKTPPNDLNSPTYITFNDSKNIHQSPFFHPNPKKKENDMININKNKINNNETNKYLTPKPENILSNKGIELNNLKSKIITTTTIKTTKTTSFTDFQFKKNKKILSNKNIEINEKKETNIINKYNVKFNRNNNGFHEKKDNIHTLKYDFQDSNNIDIDDIENNNEENIKTAFTGINFGTFSYTKATK